MMVPGIWELLIIGGIVVLLFGAKKLPSLGGAVGESIKNFRKGIKEGEETKSLEHGHDSEAQQDKKKDA